MTVYIVIAEIESGLAVDSVFSSKEKAEQWAIECGYYVEEHSVTE